jgi:two-component system, cell cycle sensor histidine kinase and response regulator CckA
MGEGIETTVSKRQLKNPLFQSFYWRILHLGLVAGFIPLVFMLFIFGLFSEGLLQDLHQSLTDLKGREGQRLEKQQHRLIHQQVRQKALDVAQNVTSYIKNHPGQTWPQMRQDPLFREMVLQPVGMVGETFLMTAQDKKILMHSDQTYEDKSLAQAVCSRENVADPPDLRFAGTPSLQEFSLAPGAGLETYCHGFLVPLWVKPLQGPELMVGAWVDTGEMDQIIAQSRAIFKTALNVTGTIIENRLGQFRRNFFSVLAGLGLLAFLASAVLARRLISQVGALTQAAEAFDEGDLSYRIKDPGRDELGQLARTLNRMAASLKENTISRMDWENTFNVLPDPVILVDTEGRLTRLNRAAAFYLDVFPDEALGCHVSELRPAGQDDWFPGQALRQALEHGQKTRIENCPDHGHMYLVSVDPCRDQKGEISGAVFVARDITALKQMQKELAQATYFLDQLIESAPLGLTFINPQGLIIKANAQFYQEFGYKPEDTLHRHYSFLYVSETEQQQVLAEIQAKGEVLGRQVQLQHSLGQQVPARISIRKLFDEKGDVLGSVCLVSNISEEVSLRRQLEQAQKQEVIATLAGGLAHNFNNLLMVIMGLTTLVLSRINPDHPVYTDLVDIERQVRAGREITRKLLSFRRASDFHTRPVDLNNLLETTADMFARTRPELVIHKELSPHLPAVEVDSGQIQQVLMNLLINAWQAMPGGGDITLQTRAVNLTDWHDHNWEMEPGSYVCLSVTDTGVGMDEETVRHLYKPFFTTKEPGHGSGLGLASAYRIMKNHRGAIQVRSKPGEGSTFTLFFPASSALPLDLSPEEKRIVSGQGTILLVEDEPVLRRVARKLLEKLGYQVVEAANGEQALRVYAERNRDIDLVLLDLIMPGLNGLQTLERLRDLDPRVKVILCSGIADTEEENLPEGVSFMPKPFPLETLSQKVAAALTA